VATFPWMLVTVPLRVPKVVFTVATFPWMLVTLASIALSGAVRVPILVFIVAAVLLTEVICAPKLFMLATMVSVWVLM